MKDTHKVILILSCIVLTLCCMMSGSPGGQAVPAPTRSMEDSVIQLAKIYGTPTGRALMNNIMWFDFEDEQWTAESRGSDWDWLVQFHYTLNGERHFASWSYRIDLKQLVPLDYGGRFLFNNP